MEILDPRLALLTAGTAAVASERVRKTVGRGLGYALAGTIKVAGPVARPVVAAARDITDEARGVVKEDSSQRRPRRRSAT